MTKKETPRNGLQTDRGAKHKTQRRHHSPNVLSGQGPTQALNTKPHYKLSPIEGQARGLLDNSIASQRSRFLKCLQESEYVTTLGARQLLDILHPAARCQELRRKGHPVLTYWCIDVTPEGKSHRVAKYVLHKTKQLSLLDLPENSAKREG